MFYAKLPNFIHFSYSPRPANFGLILRVATRAEEPTCLKRACNGGGGLMFRNVPQATAVFCGTRQGERRGICGNGGIKSRGSDGAGLPTQYEEFRDAICRSGSKDCCRFAAGREAGRRIPSFHPGRQNIRALSYCLSKNIV